MGVFEREEGRSLLTNAMNVYLPGHNLQSGI